VITAIRNVRGEMNISPSVALSVVVQSEDGGVLEKLLENQMEIVDLARLSAFSVQKPVLRPKAAATAIVQDATVFVLLEGIIDFAREAGRLEKEIDKLATELAGVSKKLHNEDFLNKAPADVVEKVVEKHKELIEKQGKLQAHLERIRSMIES